MPQTPQPNLARQGLASLCRWSSSVRIQEPLALTLQDLGKRRWERLQWCLVRTETCRIYGTIFAHTAHLNRNNLIPKLRPLPGGGFRKERMELPVPTNQAGRMDGKVVSTSHRAAPVFKRILFRRTAIAMGFLHVLTSKKNELAVCTLETGCRCRCCAGAGAECRRRCTPFDVFAALPVT